MGRLGRTFTAAEKSEMADKYRDGYLQRELMEIFHCGIDAVRRILQEEEVEIRSRQEAVYTPTRDEIKAGMAEMRRRVGLEPAGLIEEYDKD